MAPGPAGAQDDGISVTPTEALVDGQTVEISASTTGPDYGMLMICPENAVPMVGTDTTSLLSTRDICVGLACLYDDIDADIAESVEAGWSALAAARSRSALWSKPSREVGCDR